MVGEPFGVPRRLSSSEVQHSGGMSTEFSPELRAELLVDYYTEADEHLGNIRTQLAALESAPDLASPDPAAVETIFRSAHSFKGISAMVGFRSAEQLAHAAEDFLRALTRKTATLSAESFEVLLATSQRLEQIVTAHRLERPVPDIADLLQQLGRLHTRGDGGGTPAPAAPTTAADPDPARGNEEARASGLARWVFTFAPSPERDQRGVNINSVRARLAASGTILSATPIVKPGGGGITFEFVVGLREPPGDPAIWEADGISVRPAEEPSATTTHHDTPDENRPSLFIAPSHVVRVDLSRLDELMRIAGELVIHRSRLEERINGGVRDAGGLREVNQALGRSLRDLRTAINRVRLVPIAEIFTRMPFVVRDLATESGKKVRLLLEGQQTEIDKYLVERLKEPLLHLVRNAFSHGIETPQERIAAGKPAAATILLRAETAGDAVLIHIRDDGRGIDATAIARRATELGVAAPTELDGAWLLSVLCKPGFSTREEADRAAGRGMGMTVVRDTLRELGGILTLDTKPGQGTQFTLRLPLTLSIAEVLIAAVGAQTCAVPQGSIAEIVEVAEADVRTIKRTEVVPYRDGLLPLVRLRNIFKNEAAARPQIPVLVIQSERGRAGLVVDRVHTQREVVVRPLRDPLLQVPGISGATELGDGRPVLILDAIALTQGVVRPHEFSFAEDAPSPATLPS